MSLRIACSKVSARLLAAGPYFVLASFIGTACLAEPQALTCPAGSRFAEEQTADGTLVFQHCLNDAGKIDGFARYLRHEDRSIHMHVSYRNGVLDGPVTWFYPDGAIEAEGLNKSGHRLRARFTLEALRRLAAEHNEGARASGANWRVSVIDIYTLQYKVAVGQPWAWLPWKYVSAMQRVQVDADMCRIFSMEFSEVEEIKITYVNDNDEVLGGETVTTRECSKVDGSI